MIANSKRACLAPLGLAAGMIAAACGDPTPEPAAPSYEPLGSTHVTPSGPSPDAPAPPLEPAPEEARRFAAAVRALGEHGQPDHADIVLSLEALADALAVVAPSRADLIDVIRSSAEELQRSPATSDTHSDLVRRAFDAAHLVALSGTPRDRWDLSEYLTTVRELYDAKQLVDPRRPLLEQHRQVVRAFEAAVAALEVALGQPLVIPTS